jgi:hypothetical protein
MLLAVVAVAVRPAHASACDYGYQALPELFDASTDVFVGTVTESVFSRGADGQIVPRLGAGAVSDFRFKVLARYKGAVGNEVVLSNGLSDCAYPFVEGATYMVHAFVTSEGRLVSGQASRPILISLDGRSPAPRDNRDPASLWSSELAITYAEARSRPRPNAFIMASLSGVSGDVMVYAERVGGGPSVTVRAPNTPWNVYEMVLSPGEYRFGVRQSGIQIGDAVTLSVVNGESRRVGLGPGRPR